MAKKDRPEKNRARFSDVGEKIASSTFFVSKTLLSMAMPQTAASITSIKDNAYEITDALRHGRITLKRQMNRFAPRNIKGTFDKAMSDLTGDSYGFDSLADDNFDSFDDLDFGDDDGDTFEESETETSDGEFSSTSASESTRNSKQIAKAIIGSSTATIDGLKEMTMVISKNQLSASKALGDQLSAQNTFALNLISSHLMQTNNKLDVINANLVSMMNFQSQNVGVTNKAMLEYFDKSLDMLAQIKAATGIPEKRNRSGSSIDDYLGDMGFDLSGYLEKVKSGWQNSMFGTLFELMGSIQQMGGSFGIKDVLGMFAGGGKKRGLGKLDANIHRYLKEAIYRIGDLQDSDNMFLQMIGEIFGESRKTRSKLNLGNFYKEQMGWNGIAQKTLVEVIPGYLARIESHITGQEERFFDMDKGYFRTVTSIKASHEKQTRDRINSSMYEMRDILEEALSRNNVSVERKQEIHTELNRLLNQRIEKNQAKASSQYMSELGKTLQGTMNTSQYKELFIAIEDGLEQVFTALREQNEELEESLLSSHVYRNIVNREDAGTKLSDGKRDRNGIPFDVDMFKGTFSSEIGQYGSEDFVKMQGNYLMPEGKTFTISKRFRERYLKAIKDGADTEKLDQLIQSEAKSQGGGTKVDRFIDRVTAPFRGTFDKVREFTDDKIERVDNWGFRLGFEGNPLNNFTGTKGKAKGMSQSDPSISNIQTGTTASGKPTRVKTHGCGPLAMTNVLDSFGKESSVENVVNLAQSNGWLAEGGATADFFLQMAGQFGLNAKQASLSKTEDIEKALRAGSKVIVTGKGGRLFSTAGHAIVISGIDKKGTVNVYNPETGRTTKGKLSTVLTHATGAFAIDNKPLAFGPGDRGGSRNGEATSQYNIGDASRTASTNEAEIDRLAERTSNSLKQDPTKVTQSQLNKNVKNSMDLLQANEELMNEPGERSFLSTIKNAIVSVLGTFANFIGSLFGVNGWLSEFFNNERVEKIKEKLIGEEDGLLRDQWKYTKRLITGKGYTTKDGEVVEDTDKAVVKYIQKLTGNGVKYTKQYLMGTSPEDEESETAKGAIIQTGDKSDYTQKNMTVSDAKGDSTDNGIVNNLSNAIILTDNDKKEVINTVKETIKQGAEKASANVFGTQEFYEQPLSFFDNFKNIIGDHAPKLITAGAIGAGIGTLTALSGPGLLGALFLPTGPIGGAIAAAGLTLVSQTETFKEFLFGEKNKDGEREGGLIDKEQRKSFKKMLPLIVGSSALGAAKSLIFGSAVKGPFGFLLNTLLPGGPIGGALLGLGGALLFSNTRFKEILFGEKGEDGKFDYGLLSGAMNKANEIIGANKDAFKSGLKGLGIGAVTGAALSHMGLIGSALSLGGPIGMGILGLGVGIASSTERFQRALFGYDEEYEENGELKKTHHEGIIGKARNLITINILEPLKQTIHDRMEDFAGWAKKNIMAPFAQAFGPIADNFLDIKDNIVDYVRDKIDSITKLVTDIVKTGFSKLFKPITNVIGGILKGAANVTAFAAKLALSPLSGSLKALSMLTTPARFKNSLDVTKGVIQADLGAMGKIITGEGSLGKKALAIGGVLFNKDKWRAARKGYAEGSEEEGRNTFGWMTMKDQLKDMKEERKQIKAQRAMWKRVDKIRKDELAKENDKGAIWSQSRTKAMRKKFKAAFGDDFDFADGLDSASKIKDLIYDKDIWQRNVQDVIDNRGKPAKITPGEAQVSEDVEHVEDAIHQSNEYLDYILQVLKGIAKKDITEHDRKKEEKTGIKVRNRKLKKARRHGIKVDELNLDSDLDFDIDDLFDIPAAEWAKYEDSPEARTGDFIKWYEKNNRRWTDSKAYIAEQEAAREAAKPIGFPDGKKRGKKFHGFNRKFGLKQQPAPQSNEAAKPDITSAIVDSFDKLTHQSELQTQELMTQNAVTFGSHRYKIPKGYKLPVPSKDIDEAREENSNSGLLNKVKNLAGKAKKSAQEKLEDWKARGLGLWKKVTGAPQAAADELVNYDEEKDDPSKKKQGIFGKLFSFAGAALSAFGGFLGKIGLGAAGLAAAGAFHRYLLPVVGPFLKSVATKAWTFLFGGTDDDGNKTEGAFIKVGKALFGKDGLVVTGVKAVAGFIKENAPTIISAIGDVATKLFPMLLDTIKEIAGPVIDAGLSLIKEGKDWIFGTAFGSDDTSTVYTSEPGTKFSTEEFDKIHARGSTVASFVDKETGQVKQAEITKPTQAIKTDENGVAVGVQSVGRWNKSMIASRATVAAGTVARTAYNNLVKEGTKATLKTAAKTAGNVVAVDFAEQAVLGEGPLILSRFLSAMKDVCSNSIVVKALATVSNKIPGGKLLTSLFNWVSDTITKILSKLSTSRLGTKISEIFAKLSANVNMEAIKTATLVLKVADVVAGAALGATHAAEAFKVPADQVDWKMRLISAAYEAVLGIIPFGGVVFATVIELGALLFGYDIKKELFSFLYNLFTGDGEDLDRKQAIYQIEVDNYNKANGTQLDAIAYSQLTHKNIFQKAWSFISGKKDENQYAASEAQIAALDSGTYSGYTAADQTYEDSAAVFNSVGDQYTAAMASQWEAMSVAYEQVASSSKKYATDAEKLYDIYTRSISVTDTSKYGFWKWHGNNDNQFNDVAYSLWATDRTFRAIPQLLSESISNSTASYADILKGLEDTSKAVKNNKTAGSAAGYGDALSQKDPRWANMPLGRTADGKQTTMENGGCGPTALAEVAKASGRKVDPSQVASMAKGSGYIVDGGSSGKLFTEGAKKLGLNSKSISPNNLGDYLKNGNQVILSGVGSGNPGVDPYTKAGHIVTATGMDNNGNVTIKDPRTGKASSYPMSVVQNGSTGAWAFGGAKGYGDDDSMFGKVGDIFGKLGSIITGYGRSKLYGEEYKRLFDDNGEYFESRVKDAEQSAGITTTITTGTTNVTTGDNRTYNSSASVITSSGITYDETTNDGINYSWASGNTAFINFIGNLAVANYPKYHVLPSIAIGQGILESGWGKLATGHNLFGITAGSSWKGRTIKKKSGLTFRDYNSFEESVIDYLELLNKPLYAPVIAANTWREAADQLQKCGYCGDSYAELVKGIISDYKLYEWDKKVNRNTGYGDTTPYTLPSGSKYVPSQSEFFLAQNSLPSAKNAILSGKSTVLPSTVKVASTATSGQTMRSVNYDSDGYQVDQSGNRLTTVAEYLTSEDLAKRKSSDYADILNARLQYLINLRDTWNTMYVAPKEQAEKKKALAEIEQEIELCNTYLTQNPSWLYGQYTHFSSRYDYTNKHMIEDKANDLDAYIKKHSDSVKKQSDSQKLDAASSDNTSEAILGTTTTTYDPDYSEAEFYSNDQLANGESEDSDDDGSLFGKVFSMFTKLGKVVTGVGRAFINGESYKRQFDDNGNYINGSTNGVPNSVDGDISTSSISGREFKFGEGQSPKEWFLSTLTGSRVTADFGGPESGGYVDSYGNTHTGIDFAAAEGTKISTPVSGTVHFSGLYNPSSYNGGYGYYVIIKDTNGYYHYFCHMCEQSPLATNDSVTRGRVIGLVGSSGNSTGAHLHYEIRDKDNKTVINPNTFRYDSGTSDWITNPGDLLKNFKDHEYADQAAINAAKTTQSTVSAVDDMWKRGSGDGVKGYGSKSSGTSAKIRVGKSYYGSNPEVSTIMYTGAKSTANGFSFDSAVDGEFNIGKLAAGGVPSATEEITTEQHGANTEVVRKLNVAINTDNVEDKMDAIISVLKVIAEKPAGYGNITNNNTNTDNSSRSSVVTVPQSNDTVDYTGSDLVALHNRIASGRRRNNLQRQLTV